MKKILHSIGSIILVATVLTASAYVLAGSTAATGDTFATGVIDLKIDNESYVTGLDGKLKFSSSTSWSLGSLKGKLFFDFHDLKPGDVGEDTISLHTNKEKSWACMKINMKETPENGINEPEMFVDATSGANEGELQNKLYFAFWADDGDNVFEKDEKIFKKGLAKDLFNGEWWALSDSETNIWQKEGWNHSYKYDQKWNKNQKCEPLPEKSVKYIGKIWCFGDITEQPLNQDGKGKVLASRTRPSNGPIVRGTGWQCDGQATSNEYQTDGIVVDVSFTALQSKNNTNFVCGETNYNDGYNKPKPYKPWSWFSYYKFN